MTVAAYIAAIARIPTDPRRIDVHVNPAEMPLRRKRVQPRGARPCPGCARAISANADRCRACISEKKELANAV